ncbi:MAG: DoxX family protein [Cytophagaceae bacterium]|nr:DoxX family protein [Cytophagaceae bacterium]
MKQILLYPMAAFYVYSGVMHFVRPKFFLRIVPPYVPAHDLMVALSGAVEIIVGVGLLFPATRVWAAWGLIALLIAVFPANVYMAYGERFQAISPWIRWGRLPLQAVLIWWAYLYTRG